MRVKLSITLDVDAVEDNGVLSDKSRVLRSVREGIERAVRYGQGENFVHELSSDGSVMLAGVGEAIEEPAIP